MAYDNPRPSSQPIGSTDLAVAKDNLTSVDIFVNSEDLTFTNRKGVVKKTAAGAVAVVEDAATQALIDINADAAAIDALATSIEADAEARLVVIETDAETRVTAIETDAENRISTAVESAGSQIVGDFADVTKVVITESNQVYTSKSVAGFEDYVWRTNQILPYTPTGSDPTQAQEAGKWLAVAIGELKAIARSLNVLDSQIIYATDTVTVLGGVLYIYDAATQKTWAKPANVGATEVIVSVSAGGVLTTSGGSYQLINYTNASELIAIARSLNRQDSDVGYGDAGLIVKPILYAKDQQVVYSAPAAAIGKTILSVFTDTLNTTDSSEYGLMRASSHAEVNIDDFGATGSARLFNGDINPSATDDTVAIQTAFIAAAKMGNAKVVATSWKAYKTTSTIYIPTLYRSPSSVWSGPNESKVVYDFNGCEFIGPDINTAVLFESGYFDVSGDLVTNWGQPNEMYLTTNTAFGNFTARGYRTVIRPFNWVYGCKIHNILAGDCAQVIDEKRCFYTHFEQLTHRGNYLVGVPIFKFSDNSNIMPLKGLVTGSCDIGFDFSGSMEALRLVECGIEGFATIGVRTSGAYQIKFESCYFESNAGVGYSSTAGTPHVTFENCWGLGDFPMIGPLADNTKIKINNNNSILGDCRWYDSLPSYCVSDFELPSRINGGGAVIGVYDATDAVNVNQDIVVYDGAIGLASVLGRVEQTNDFHTQRVNGRIGQNYNSDESRSVGCVVALIDNTTNYQYSVTTGIDFVDTQCIYFAFRVFHNTGTATYFGHVYGGTYVSVPGFSGGVTVANVGGKVVITTGTFSHDSPPNAQIAEARII